MPEMSVTVRWPGGHVEEHYSPSPVVHDYLRPGVTYTVEVLTMEPPLPRASGDSSTASAGRPSPQPQEPR